MKAFLTLLILLLTLGCSFGQQISLAGRVLDAKQVAVPFATVVLVVAGDSAVVGNVPGVISSDRTRPSRLTTNLRERPI